MTMDRHQIAIGVISSLLIAMRHLQERLGQEDESTMSTASVLGMQ
jgi:hypothetical protein